MIDRHHTAFSGLPFAFAFWQILTVAGVRGAGGQKSRRRDRRANVANRDPRDPVSLYMYFSRFLSSSD